MRISTPLLLALAIAGCSTSDKGVNPTGGSVANTPPTIGGVELTPDPGFENTQLTCQVIGLDDVDGDEVSVSYTWTVSGTEIAATSATLNGADFDKYDTVSCTATPNDGFSPGSPVASNQVDILNTPPSGTNVDLGPNPANALSTLTATPAGWSDADGDPESWQYQWFVNNQSAGVQTSTMTGGFAKGDEVYTIATPNDLDELGEPLQSNVLTIVNTPPTLAAADLNPTAPLASDVLICSPQGPDDIDGDVISYQFEWFVNGAAGGSGTDILTAPSFTSGDEVYCVITPTDLEDDGVSVQSNSVIIGNGAPTMASVTLAPDPAYEDTVLSCAPNGLSDPDGDPITLAFSWTVSGLPIAVASSTLDGTFFDRGDVVQCTAIANDGTADSAPTQSNNVLIQNSLPTATTVVISPAIPFTDTDVTATAFGWTDLDGDPENYQFAWAINGMPVPGGTTDTLPSAAFVKHDLLIVSATPDDGVDLGVPVLSVAVEVQNSLPTLAAVDIAPATPVITDTLSCVPSGPFDADNDVVNTQFEWFVNGLPAGFGTNLLPPSEFASGDLIYCQATPNDGEDDGLPVQSGGIVIDNTAPSLASVLLTPDPAYEDTVLLCTPQGAVDPDGDPVSFEYSWTVNGAPVLGSTDTLDGSQFNRDDTVQCSVVATDGTADSLPVGSNFQGISNTAPSATNIVIGPAAPQTYDDVTIYLSGWDDLDGDPEDYMVEWFVNGASVPGETRTSLSSVYYAKNDLVYGVAYPFDGTDLGAPLQSLEIAIINTPPTLASASAGPSNPTAADTLSCSGSGQADDDGDPVTLGYEWVIDGVLQGPGTAALPAPAAGSAVYCIVTPNDGDEDGLPLLSNTLTVENSAPTIASVSLAPDPAFEDSVFTCTANGVVDADGSIPTLTYAWTVGGLPLAITTATLDGTYFDRDQAVQCSVIADDGVVASAPGLSNIVVVSNSVPSALDVSIAPPDPRTSDNVFLTVNGWSDLDGDPENYRYQWFVDSIAIPGATSTALPSAFYSKHEFLSVEATPDDGTDLGSPIYSLPVEVLNTPPTLVNATLGPANPVTTDTLSCAGQGPADGDGDPVISQYAWTVNGTVIGTTTSTLQTPDFTAGDSVFCTVTPNDGEENGVPVLSATVSISNTAPTIGSVTLTPEPAFENTVLSCTANSVIDLDGDPLTYTYLWTVAGLPVLPTGNTLDGTYFDRDQAVQCQVTVNDGLVDSAITPSNTLVVRNTAPSASSVVIAPAAPYTDNTVTLTTAGWFDLDGDVEGYAYQWSINGIAIPGATSTALPSAFFAKNDVLTVTATPDDGTDQGPTLLSPSVTVLNTPPALAAADLSPNSPLATDVLTCTDIGTTDTDADTVSLSYAWFVNGAPAGGGNTLAAPAFANGDSVYCVITPNDGDEDGLSVQSNAVGIDNTAPTIASVSLSPDPAYEDTLLSCAYAGAADADGDPLTFSYSWLVNGLPITATTVTLDGADFDRDDIVQCRVVANDGAADSVSAPSNPITIRNSVPSATSVDIAPVDPRTDDSVSLSTSGWLDLDGDGEAYDYQWFVNGVAVPGANSTALLSANYGKGDVLTVQAVPNDGTDTGTPLLSAPVTVLNTPPVMASVSLAPNAPLISDTLVCTGTGGADLDGDSVTYGYSWYVNGGLIAASSSTLSAPDFSSGDAVYCVVTPNDGDEDGAPVQSNTANVDNSAPTISSATLSPVGAFEDTQLTCAAVGAADLDGDAISFSYTWTVNGLPIAPTTATLDGVDFNRDDAVQCQVVANDGTANSAPAVSNAVVIQNSAPSAVSVDVTPANATTTDNVSLTTSGWSDLDGDTEAYDFQWYVNGIAVPGATSTTLLASNYVKGDLVAVRAIPNDGTDTGTPLLSAAVTIQNTPPSLSLANLGPANPQVSDTLSCTPVGPSDADGDSVSAQYSWYVNGALMPGNTNQLSAPDFANGDTVYCLVTPNDGTDSGTPAQSNTVSIANSAPTLASVSLSPVTAYEDTTLSCAPVGAFDADGDSLTFGYAWSVNGLPLAATSATLTGADFDRDDTVQCRITANDGSTNSATVASNSVVISNSPPSATGVSIAPVLPYTTDALSLTTAGWSDIDGDLAGYDYQWSVNGIAVPGATSTSLGAANYVRGDVVTVTALPNDGTDTGTPVVSPPVTVQNTAPTLGSVSLVPGSPQVSDTLNCAPSGSADADSDAISVSYAWYVNGGLIGPSASVLNAPNFANGDSVYCVVTPDDGTDSGAPVQSNTVNIANTAPTLSSVSLTPTTAYEDSTFTCAAVGATDADGDALSLTYAWQVNGLAIAPTGSTLTGASFDRDDTVRCSIIANDGSANSATVLSNVVVVSNSLPSASSVSVAPSAPTTTTNVSLSTAGWSDLDGDLEGYDYQWFVNGIAVPGATSTALLAANYVRGDVLTARAIPNDGTDTGTPLISSPVVVVNSLPALASVDLTPTIPLITDTLTCTPNGPSDADSDTVTASFAWYVSGVFLPGATTNQLSAPDFGNGDGVYCLVTPNDGTADGVPVQSNPVSINNTVPTVASAILTPTTAYEATTFTCAAVGANDADGDPLTIGYSWTVNGVPVAPTTATLTGTYFDRDDTVQCQATANDGAVTSVPAASNNVIVNNTAPSATTAVIAPASPQTYDDVSVSVSGWFDIDGDLEGYTYQWSVNGVPVFGATASSLSSANYFRDDLITVVVTPFDGTDSGSPIVAPGRVVLNTAPTLTSASITPASPQTGEQLTCNPSGAGDDDGDGISYTYAWYVNTGLVGTGSTLSAPNTGDLVYCVVTPTDGTDAGTPVQSGAITVVNSPPTIGSVTLTPTTAYEGTTLTCTANAVTDPDGDGTTLAFTWTVGGVGIGATSATLTGANFDKNQAVRCTVTANDGGSNSAPVMSNVVTISNTAPMATSVSISPIDPQTTNDVGLTITGWFDIDGDAENYQYQWYKNTVLIPGATSSVLPAASHAKADFLTVRVWPYDGTDTGAPLLSSPVEVLNTPPTAPAISVSPDPADDGDTLLCSIDVGSFDADSDTITYNYAWNIGGTPTGQTGNTVPGTATSLGEVWTCVATPDDAEDLGPSVSAFVVITDTVAPGAPVLDALDPYDNDNTYAVTGSGEPGATITLTAVCDGASSGVLVGTANIGTGLFSFNMSVAYGESCTFTATATDFFGNLSGNSNQIGTLICPVPDVYEGAGYGDTMASAIDEWADLLDDGLNTYFLEGNILDNDPTDWFVVRGLDDPIADHAAYTNTYNFRAQITDLTGQYTFVVHKGALGATVLECPLVTVGYDDYNDFWYDQGDAPNHTQAFPTNRCRNGSSLYNNCENMGQPYYVQVIRDPAVTFDCTNYQITVTNGL